MSDLMRPLHTEHQLLLPYIEELRRTADDVGLIPVRELEVAVEACRLFLFDRLIPHAEVETEVMYPVVARLMGNTDATATMIKDHEEVVQLAEELESLSKELQRERRLDDELAVSLRRVLYGLYTIIGLHFAKEEELYAPLLERGLSPEEARVMFQKLEMLG
jgi:hypothetical protein